MPADADLPRFFVPGEFPSAEGTPESRPSPFIVGQEVTLPTGEAHHAAHVLRLREGAAVEVFDGDGAAAAARITEVRKGSVTVSVIEVRPKIVRPEPLVHLAFAVPKGNRLDWLLEKATELGVAALVPLRFQRSVAGGEDPSAAKRERWLGHTIAAAKQAGLRWLPRLENPQTLEHFISTLHETSGVFGDLGPEALPLVRALGRLDRTRPVSIVVGPEGGLTPTEREALIKAGLAPVRIGSTTLRIETAAIALIAATTAVFDPAK
jgi:16S rRNA (uracil1498-N3)-methyltransferase